MRISSLKYKKKPKSTDVARFNGINKNLVMQSEINPNLESLAEAIGDGKTLLIDNINHNSTNLTVANFKSTYFIGIDIDDEEYLKQSTAYELTGNILNANGFNWYLRYKTFSYTDDCPKHRYLLKFDTPLDQLQALSVYKALSAILPLDSATSKNLCRLWFGSAHKLQNNDKQGKVVAYADFDFGDLELSNDDDDIDFEISKNHKIELTLKNINFSTFDLVKYAEEVVNLHSNWHHDIIYNSVYSVAVIIYKQTGDIGAFEVFLANVPATKNKSKIERQNSYKLAFKNNVKSNLKTPAKALNLLKKLTKNTSVNVFDNYNMFRHAVKTNLNEREQPFINADDINAMQSLSLLVAPAGAGKTTAIIDYALNIAKKHVVLMVPLVPIIQKLEQKYANFTQIEYLYSNSKNGSFSKCGKNSSLKLTICTTEAYYLNTNNNYGGLKYIQHQLFIDEAHEVVSFFGIDGLKNNTKQYNLREKKGEITKKVLFNIPKDTTFVTATPFNLADVFKQVKVFVKSANKPVKFIKTRGSKATIVDILNLEKNKDKKVLIYVNSKTKLTNLERILTLNFPQKKISSIYSGGQKADSLGKEDYTNIINSNNVKSDVIITTKYLNVGVDINNVFNLVIYADNKLDLNSCLQLFNRERQKCEFIVLYAVKKSEHEVNININTQIKPDQIDVLVDMDIPDNVKQMLIHFLVFNDEIKKSVISQHIYVDQTKYKHLVNYMNVDTIKQAFSYFYPNISFEDFESVKSFENDKKKPITQQMRAKRYHDILSVNIDIDNINTDLYYNYDIDKFEADEYLINLFKMQKIDKVSKFEHLVIVRCLKKNNIMPNNLKLSDIELHTVFNRRLNKAIDFVVNNIQSFEIAEIRKLTCEYGAKLFYLADSVDLKKLVQDCKKIGYCINKLRDADTLNSVQKSQMCDYFNENNFHYHNVKWSVKNFVNRAEIFGFYFERKTVNIGGQRVKLTVNQTVQILQKF